MPPSQQKQLRARERRLSQAPSAKGNKSHLSPPPPRAFILDSTLPVCGTGGTISRTRPRASALARSHSWCPPGPRALVKVSAAAPAASSGREHVGAASKMKQWMPVVPALPFPERESQRPCHSADTQLVRSSSSKNSTPAGNNWRLE